MGILGSLQKFARHYLYLDINRLYKGEGREKDRFEYQKKLVSFKIKAGDKVLDIGSGDNPFPLATHLADLYPHKTSHRAKKLIRDSRPFFVCDIEKLPFKNNEFDFVYCSHVLEHTKDPAKACEEIMRVGKRGYIETPTKTSDIMFNFLRLKSHHKWYIEKRGNSLIFFEYDPKERRDTGTNHFFNMYHSEYKNPFQDLMRKNRSLFNNMFLWNRKFDYFVFNRNGVLVKTNQK